MARSTFLAALTAVAVGAGAAGLAVWSLDRNLPWEANCRAGIAGDTVVVDLEQAQNSALITSVALRRGLPTRAVTIALATAFQESDLHNVDYGDRDSLGLFQQRPSQGWGTADQVLDPTYAAGAFFDALVRVRGYEDLPVTVAAQRVQRSAYPDAYAQHEREAQTLALALTGQTPAGLSCRVDPATTTAQVEGPDGLTERAEAVRAALQQAFGSIPMGGFQPGGVDAGHIEGSAHYDGRAIDLSVTPGDPKGWILAHWLVANAQPLDLATVIYADRIWTARRSAEGWRPYEYPGAGPSTQTTRHLDHVHVDVLAGG